MTCPYEIESGCEFAEEVLTADAAQTTRTYFEQQQLQQDFAEVQELLVQLSRWPAGCYGTVSQGDLPGKCVCRLDRETRKCA